MDTSHYLFTEIRGIFVPEYYILLPGTDPLPRKLLCSVYYKLSDCYLCLDMSSDSGAIYSNQNLNPIDLVLWKIENNDWSRPRHRLLNSYPEVSLAICIVNVISRNEILRLTNTGSKSSSSLKLNLCNIKTVLNFSIISRYIIILVTHIIIGTTVLSIIS